MKLKKTFLIMLGIVMLISLASAEPAYTFKKGQTVNYSINVFESDNSKASDSVACYITMKNPESAVTINDSAMTFNVEGYFNYTINASLFENVGEYPTIIRCDDGSEYAFSTFTFLITPTGQNITESQGFTSIGLIISILAVAFLFMYFGFKFAESDKLFPIAIFFMLISLLLSVYTIHLGYIYSRDILYPLAGEGTQFKVYLGIMWGLLAMAFLAMLGLIIKALKEFRVRKSQQDYGEGWDSKTQSYK